MANEDIRKEIESAGVRHWQVADAIGVSENTFIRWLRKELPDEKKAEVRSAIKKISK